MRVAVLGSGRGSNLEALLQHCQSGTVAAKVSLVISNKPNAGCLDVAARHNIPSIVALPREAKESRDAYDARLLEILQAEQPDLIVLAGYMRILTHAVIDAFAGRIINIHPSLLPAFPGAHGVSDAHAAGAKIVGCTSHIVTPELDAGPLILQAAIAPRPDDSVEKLARRVLRLEHLILPRTVQLWATGRITVDHGHAIVSPGDSWLRDDRIELVSGALFGEGF